MIKQVLVAAFAFVATCVLIVMAGYRIYAGRAFPPAASGQAMLLEEAFALYRADHDGQLPPPGTNAEYVRALRAPGEDAVDYIAMAAVTFKCPISLREEPASKTETAIDVWGRPFAFEPQPDGSMRVLSAGPNGTPGDADDITSEQARALDARGEGGRPKR